LVGPCNETVATFFLGVQRNLSDNFFYFKDIVEEAFDYYNTPIKESHFSLLKFPGPGQSEQTCFRRTHFESLVFAGFEK
jgi:hypothetical protein